MRLAENLIDDTFTALLCDFLKTSTTLTELGFNCKHQNIICVRWQFICIHSYEALGVRVFSPNRSIGERGATSMSDALKSNTTLTKLDVGCKHKRNT